jgi:hypothetical protein
MKQFLNDKGAALLFALLLIFAACLPSDAQTPVILAPVPKLQFFNEAGVPLAFGCVFTYESLTTTPLTTYTDHTGDTANSNPVILDGGGFANGQTASGGIWLQAGLAYTFKVVSAGGTNCGSGSTLYTIDGIGGGSTTLTTIVPFSSTPSFVDAAQNQLFKITLTGNATSQPMTFVGVTPPGFIAFQITQDGSGGHTFAWPSNVVGGCTIGSAANGVTTQLFVYNGTNATAIGPCVTATGPVISAGNIFDYGLSASSIVCTDANKQLNTSCGSGGLTSTTVNGQTCASGGACNVNAGNAAHSVALNEGNGDQLGAVLLAASQILIGAASADPVASTLPTCTGTALSYSGTPPLTCISPVAVLASTITQATGDVTVSGLTSVLAKAVTFPASGCPCRAFVAYGYYANAGSHGVMQAYVTDATNTMATTQLNIYNDGNSDGREGSSFSPATYANSATVTFTLTVNPASGGSWTVSQANTGSVGQDTWLNVAVFASN